ncbi:MAG: 16S rRNA (guanine(527)-N(7))-methyltransferase RsmG [Blastocatellia bacterium]
MTEEMIHEASSQIRELLTDRYPLLSEEVVGRFSRYYGLVLKWNPRLHLTTLTEPHQFLARHVDEVLFASQFVLEGVTSIWDLGSGLGVPGIPLKILRPELEMVLVESSRKKAIFLEIVISEIGLVHSRVDCQRIEALSPLPAGSLLTARAVEQMERLVPQMIHLSRNSFQILLFCSRSLCQSLDGAVPRLIPGSSDRYIADLKCST